MIELFPKSGRLLLRQNRGRPWPREREGHTSSGMPDLVGHDAAQWEGWSGAEEFAVAVASRTEMADQVGHDGNVGDGRSGRP